MDSQRQRDTIAAIMKTTARHTPRTPPELHYWLQAMLRLNVPLRPRIAGHAAPFDYLTHAFFERGRTHRNAIVWASRGSGKTMLGAVATLLDMLFKPGIEIVILGGSFAQSSRMHAHLRRMLSEEPLCELIDGNLTLTGVALRNGSRVEVICQSQRSVRGLRAHRLRCDEVELFTPEVWEAAQMITRSGLCGRQRVNAGIEALSTMHKPFGLMNALVRNAAALDAGVFRWSVMDVLERCPPRRACATCDLHHPLEGGCHGLAKDRTERGRPIRRELRGFYRIDDALDQHARASPSAWKSEMLCLQPDVSDSVYPEFDERRHVFDDDGPVPANDASISWVGGIDFGYRSPSVLLLAMLDGANVLHVMDEVYERGCRTDRLIQLARERFAKWGIGTPGGRFRFFGVDPAGLQRSDQSGVSTVTLWRRAGFVMRTRADTIEAGIEAVRTRLSSSDGSTVGLRMHRRCANLIRGLREYHYPPRREDQAPPVKDGPDHACDALRYMIVNLDARSSAVQVRGY